MSEEGLFRSSGGASKIKRLKLSIDSGCFTLPVLPEYRDLHVIAATLKCYLRELPEPLLTYTLYNEWISISKCNDEQRLLIVQDILKKLPKANKDNLTYLIQFLAKLSKHPENKMTSSNIAICIAPNLLFKKEGSGDLMGICAVSNMLVEMFINNVDTLFPDDVSQYVTLNMAEIDDKDEFVRPILDNVKLINHHDIDNDYCHPETASPRPQLRSKKRAPAPVPPTTIKHDIDINERGSISSNQISYPSGSTTLNRSHRVRTMDAPPKMKATVGTNTDAELLVKKKIDGDNVKNSEPKPVLVNVDDKTVDTCVISHTSNFHISKAKPVQQITPQISDNKINNQPIYENVQKPVAAPRSLNIELEKSTFRLENPMTKSLNSIDIDGDTVQIRNKENNDNNKPNNKPAVPVRPASLRAQPRGSIDADPTLHKTQCSVYSVANKQQPSIINVHNRNEKFQAGHDNQIAEKEKFLGHQQQQQPEQETVRVPAPRLSLENKFNDINSNCDNGSDKKQQPKPFITSKPPMTKSTEKLNVTEEKMNGNSKPSHNRTRSDGNIMDFSDNLHATPLQTPPSPKVLNKPSQPPPPPPIINNTTTSTTSTTTTTITRKSELESTDF